MSAFTIQKRIFTVAAAAVVLSFALSAKAFPEFHCTLYQRFVDPEIASFGGIQNGNSAAASFSAQNMNQTIEMPFENGATALMYVKASQGGDLRSLEFTIDFQSKSLRNRVRLSSKQLVVAANGETLNGYFSNPNIGPVGENSRFTDEQVRSWRAQGRIDYGDMLCLFVQCFKKAPPQPMPPSRPGQPDDLGGGNESRNG